MDIRLWPVPTHLVTSPGLQNLHHSRSAMKHLRTLFLIGLLICTTYAAAQDEPKAIYALAIGNWRDGPVVVISPVFETSELYNTQDLIQRMKNEYPSFAGITEIAVERFATIEEGEEARMALKGKYGMRKLPVEMLTPASVDPIHDTLQP